MRILVTKEGHVPITVIRRRAPDADGDRAGTGEKTRDGERVFLTADGKEYGENEVVAIAPPRRGAFAPALRRPVKTTRKN